MSGSTSDHPGSTSGISNDAAEKGKIDNSVPPEAEVVESSTVDSVTSPSSTETTGSLTSGQIVDAPSSTPAAAAQPSLTSSDFAASEMGNAIDKVQKIVKPDGNTAPIFAKASNDRKQVPATKKDQSPNKSKSVPGHPSSSAADVSGATTTKVDIRTADSKQLASDVAFPGNRGIPDAPNDVTTPGSTRKADTKSESSLPPLSSLFEGAFKRLKRLGYVNHIIAGSDLLLNSLR